MYHMHKSSHFSVVYMSDITRLTQDETVVMQKNSMFFKKGEADEEGEGSDRDVGTGGGLYPGAPDHDASPKPATRLKEKRMNR